MGKERLIIIRIGKDQKENWKKICSKKQISLTSLIIDSVENRILNDERRKILAFIEKQDNIFGKIENNINQVAKIVNGQKFISEKELNNFSIQLNEIADLKKQQNEVFIKIYSLIANDH
ncbi:MULTISPECIES: hypothetical protein [unclassified Chryseobacterium]|uniref:hypothetical protein n=1 Tax=unclassified Chryseobacterium TaxID=2593645 RepID=UPI000D3AD535|nr:MULTISPECIES: hypothetical protein [unclassified Chryseobacterium]PTT78455.1 hypothetical protein DBR25_00420 [Chryseobacterium sp. HMWF001]PVV54075.1 hypothetical protein DD829_18180 [Chryseobacterium sp. HMWF035]